MRVFHASHMADCFNRVNQMGPRCQKLHQMEGLRSSLTLETLKEFLLLLSVKLQYVNDQYMPL